MKKNIVIIALCISLFFFNKATVYDLAVVGSVLFADGIGRQSIGLIDCLKQTDLRLNFVNSCAGKGKPNLNDVPSDIRHYFLRPGKGPSSVAILESMLTHGGQECYKKIPSDSYIKIAYTMFEATRIPPPWVSILNRNFDAAVVPDQFLVEVYKKSGVRIPVFVIPLGVYLDDFLKLPLKTERNKIFEYLDLAAYSNRKNQKLLLICFAEVFGDNPLVKLKLNGRFGYEYFKQLQALYKRLKKMYPQLNVELSYKPLAWHNYVQAIAMADCGVNISTGEGYGVFLRECMARGLPCIAANNSGQKTICDSGLVYAVKSEIAQPAFFCGKPVGLHYNCFKRDIKAALLYIHNHYEDCLAESARRRDWARQWTYPNLRNKYYTLAKPNDIQLGDKDSIEDDRRIITTSVPFYTKMRKLIKARA